MFDLFSDPFSKVPIDDSLLDSDDIIISRRGDSFVLTNARSLNPQSKTVVKRNGAGGCIKKLGKECGNNFFLFYVLFPLMFFYTSFNFFF